MKFSSILAGGALISAVAAVSHASTYTFTKGDVVVTISTDLVGSPGISGMNGPGETTTSPYDDNGNENSSPTLGNNTLTTYNQYIVTLSTTDGTLINAVGANGSNSLFGGTYIEAAGANKSDTITGNYQDEPAETNGGDFGDTTHFLVDDSTILAVTSPTETFSKTNLAGSPADTWSSTQIGIDWGQVTKFAANYTYSLVDQATSVQLAYLVTPNSSSDTFDIEFATNNNGSVSATQEITGSFNVVPEPATLSLLGLGSLGLMARRRRRA